MFENLVESTSHKEDLARKSYFLLGTLGVYAVLGVAFFVAGIYWYDAHLENQNLELTTLVAPVPVPPQQAEPDKPKDAPKPAEKPDQPQIAMRTDLVARVDMPVAPKEISAQASKVPPIPVGQQFMKGDRNFDPAAGSGPIGPVGSGNGGGGTPPPVKMEESEPPPVMKPSPTPAPKPTAPISGGVLNGKAISLPKPAYPAIAKSAHASGTVTVQVLIDENGSVVAAHAVSGHPLLQAVAVQAARSARFSPTKLSGQPVKVSGVITYNFVAQ
ncbi:MAG TPA: TonB family protein [Pyrinomonadaceae bacterium]|jgi:protein TonB|nr:TonB family protein [Pyrinomonadaceae bacterium]